MSRAVFGDAPAPSTSTQPDPAAPSFATLNRVRLDLPTMQLRDRKDTLGAALPTLIVVPYVCMTQASQISMVLD